jgi:hypothetical protein
VNRSISSRPIAADNITIRPATGGRSIQCPAFQASLGAIGNLVLAYADHTAVHREQEPEALGTGVDVPGDEVHTDIGAWKWIVVITHHALQSAIAFDLGVGIDLQVPRSQAAVAWLTFMRTARRIRT